MKHILAFIIKPFTPDCDHIPCGLNQHCVKSINGNLTCICNVFYTPKDLNPGTLLDCQFSWVTLLLSLTFSLLSLICILWILVAICKGNLRRKKYSPFSSAEHVETVMASNESLPSIRSTPYSNMQSK
ncbi:hypothetical protein MN116_007715 [Schistosoma mekongi]|uniref:EGF-like domain-containing protein n=1 Tax=Schistosoma mekongi TaxID=38744 RepID=A0AAE1Z6J6_SCHME|nr:hypothetical protein MN116_007715 [Schistosoma mekongi]